MKLEKPRFSPEEKTDLHLHSNHSDGVYSPEQLASLAAEQGLWAVALTDHASVAGVADMTVACARLGIYCIPGVELNSSQGDILGIGIDITDTRLVDFLKHINDLRLSRIRTTLKRLAGLYHDYRISMAELRRFATPATTPSRTHIARLLVKRGVLTDIDLAFTELFRKGRPAHVHGEAPTANDCLQVIRESGGIAIEAHPHFHHKSTTDLEEHIRSLAAYGLAGYESASCSDQQQQQIQKKYQELAATHNLLAVGGSNFHGITVSKARIGRQTTPGPLMQTLLTRLPENTLHGSIFKRTAWRFENLSPVEFRKSITPTKITVDRLSFNHLKNRRPPVTEIPPGFSGLPFVLIRANAIKYTTTIRRILTEAGSVIVLETDSNQYPAIAYDLYNMSQYTTARNHLENIGRFTLDRYLDNKHGIDSRICRIIFFSLPENLHLRNLKIRLRSTIGHIRFFILTCGEFRESYLSTFIHMPEKQDINLECLRLQDCGIKLPGKMMKNQKIISK